MNIALIRDALNKALAGMVRFFTLPAAFARQLALAPVTLTNAIEKFARQ